MWVFQVPAEILNAVERHRQEVETVLELIADTEDDWRVERRHAAPAVSVRSAFAEGA